MRNSEWFNLSPDERARCEAEFADATEEWLRSNSRLIGRPANEDLRLRVDTGWYVFVDMLSARGYKVPPVYYASNLEGGGSTLKVTMSGPRFIHTCDDCVFLGRKDAYDLWFCRAQNTVIARFSHIGPDYKSGAAFIGQDPELTEAARRWNARS